MLAFFRRLTKSRGGIIITFLVLGIIAIAFAAGDVTGIGSTGGSIAANDVAKVGKAEVTENEVKSRVQTELEGYRQQQPTLDMATYVSQGGFEGTMERIISSLALEQFAKNQGMVISKRAVDGQIASIPALQGPTGKFDENLYRRVLSERKLTDAQIRGDIIRDTLTQQLILPTNGATQMPAQLALPYASLLLEKRAGSIGFIPTAAVPAGAAPSDADLATFYNRNVARYTVPERRVVRYAVITPDMVKARAVPTDAEIAQRYQQDRAKYAATEKRTITQVVVSDQAGANAIAAKAKAGTSLTDAARAAGLEASVQTGVDKTAYANATSSALADTLFAAAKGAVVGPVRGPLGWTVAKVDSIDQVAARTLDQVRAEITTALAAQKSAAALSDVHDKIDDALAKNATFDEIVTDQKLQAQTTAALTASGANPDAPASQPNPALAPLVNAAFQASEGDAPQMVQTGKDGSFAVVGLARVVAAAPRPLAQVRDAVLSDVNADRSRLAARRVAGEVLARINKGMPLAQSLGATGLKLPAPQSLSPTRAQISNNPQGAPPALALMFAMAPNTAKTLAAPDNSGWFVVKLDKIERGDASRTPAAINAARAGIGRGLGREYSEQFARAVRADVGVKTDAAAIARVKAELVSGGSSNN
ncbi:SurA N-terminal domain-containing protein [Sphingomonas sp. PB2P19]|uniref:peptidylprolyl isomerase n=1 Tax=Sphingomonas rhamnosi TaxID=3096156 RepID=UPI002FC84BFF